MQAQQPPITVRGSRESTPIMENQLQKKMGNHMEIGFIQGFMRLSVEGVGTTVGTAEAFFFFLGPAVLLAIKVRQ